LGRAGGLPVGFQAEDGIREFHVTGVQACALPILPATTVSGHQFWKETDPDARRNQLIHFLKNVSITGGLLMSTLDPKPHKRWIEIGRASCREGGAGRRVRGAPTKNQGHDTPPPAQ